MKVSTLIFVSLTSAILLSSGVTTTNAAGTSCDSFQCRDPQSDEGYSWDLEDRVMEADIDLDADEVVDDVVDDLTDLALTIASGFFPTINAAVATTNFVLSYTSASEDDNYMYDRIETALNTIITNFNSAISELDDMIDEVYDAATKYADVSDYLESVVTRRLTILANLDDYEDALDEVIADQGEDVTFGDLSDSRQTTMTDYITTAASNCVAYFGPLSTGADEILLDQEDQEIKYRLMYATDMCNLCMNVQLSAYALFATDDMDVADDFLEDYKYTLSRCLFEVGGSMVRELAEENSALITYLEGFAVGTGYNTFYTYYDTEVEDYGTADKLNSFGGYVSGGEEDWEECEWFEGCVDDDDFADFLGYTCVGEDASGNTYSKKTWAGKACAAFARTRIDNEIMDYHRQNVMYGYGDVWARALAETAKQGLVHSRVNPRSEGPYAIMSRYWGMYIEDSDLLSVNATYFTFEREDGGTTYTIKNSETGEELCDEGYCEWEASLVYDISSAWDAILNGDGSTITDTSLYFLSNVGTKNWLNIETEVDYTNGYWDDPQFITDTPAVRISFSSGYSINDALRFIRQCDDPANCYECETTDDCPWDFSYCDETEKYCKACEGDHDCPDGYFCSTSDSYMGSCEEEPEEEEDSSFCMSGDKGVTRFDKHTGAKTSTIVKDLKVGDIIKGWDENMETTKCKVTAIGKYAPKNMYDGYTSDHSVFSSKQNGMVEHGRKGRHTFEDAYEVLTDCPLATDEDYVKFAGFGHCGRGKLEWSDYLVLWDAMSTIVEGSDVDFYSADTYKNMGNIVTKRKEICDLVLACADAENDDDVACVSLELYMEEVVNNELKDDKKELALNRFPNIGYASREGSPSLAFRERRRERAEKRKSNPRPRIDEYLTFLE